jgi:3-deoxy-manno-octulosonate cytidylyltransferase (CMP-KDO synthetase)
MDRVMALPRDPIIMIPARMASSRLPNKPLADIHGEPMIVQVWRRAIEANLGRVVVACGEAVIAEAIWAVGGEAILTDPDLPSGSDRIHAALGAVDPDGRHDAIINLQGDLPVLEPRTVAATLELLDWSEVDIGTVVAEITLDEERTSTSVNKAVVAWEQPDELRGRALYFTKAPAPTGGPMFHHIGIYSYRPEVLENFVALPQSPLEKMEKLEQLRALEAGMRIDVARVDTLPLGVDTPADLERARLLLMN